MFLDILAWLLIFTGSFILIMGMVGLIITSVKANGWKFTLFVIAIIVANTLLGAGVGWAMNRLIF